MSGPVTTGPASGGGCSIPITSMWAVRDGYKDVYTHKLESIRGADIHFWYGTKEAFVAEPQARHLCTLHPDTHVEVFPGMNHGQLLVDHPKEVAGRIKSMTLSGNTK